MAEPSVRVLLARGHQATPWNLRTWEELPPRFDVGLLLTPENRFDVSEVRLRRVPARSLRRFLPPGRFGELATAGLTGDRYLGIDDALDRAEIVHAEELSYWFAADLARRKRRHRYKLVLTVWETLPLGVTFRNPLARRYRSETLPRADLFLAATGRARESLLLEGVPADKIDVCYPGIDLDRFAAGRPTEPPDSHLVISAGRLVWEKGHQDVIRALAALKDGLLPSPSSAVPRLLIVGSGPEEERLRAYARELGLRDAVELRSASYADMPGLYGRASCMVLASLPSAGCSRFFGDLPRCFWEEQFGLVLAEAMAAGLPILASRSGSIPEVAGDSAAYFMPGDWLGLARLLASGPLSRPPGEGVQHPADRVHLFSTKAAAERLAEVYDRLLARAPS